MTQLDIVIPSAICPSWSLPSGRNNIASGHQRLRGLSLVPERSESERLEHATDVLFTMNVVVLSAWSTAWLLWHHQTTRAYTAFIGRVFQF